MSTDNRLQQLLKQKKDIAERLRDMKREGDLSENSGYSQAIEELTIVDNEIFHLRTAAKDAKHQLVGARVHLEDLTTKESEVYEIVASGANPLEKKISPQSPLVKALEGKSSGDAFEVELGSRTAKYKLKRIECL